jgi:(E)-4-hydroxy-3-methylbut-2-enyl-diphosphate synthase
MNHKKHEVRIGNVRIGGGFYGKSKNPVAIQSMTNTDTADVKATVAQCMALADAGSEMIRVAVNNLDAARAVPRIKDTLLKKGYTQPIIGDFHYNGHILLKKYPDCAKALDKYRINPGNVGTGAHESENFAAMIKTAIARKKPVRIGVNWGSLDQTLLTKMPLREAMVQSALRSAKSAEKLGLPADRIVLSVKMSDVQDVIAVYRDLAARCDYSLHLGLTEAGSGDKGLIASTAALGILLQEGIGDTIRISITPEPESAASRTREVVACQLLLQSLGLRSFRPLVTSCPGCGRTANDLHQKIAALVSAHIEKKLPLWRARLSRTAFTRIANLKIAVMGCVVNGPGEASHADIGLFLPGKTEEPVAQVYLKGKPYKKLTGKRIAQEFIALLDRLFFEG